jgi:hypothetical protein
MMMLLLSCAGRGWKSEERAAASQPNCSERCHAWSSKQLWGKCVQSSSFDCSEEDSSFLVEMHRDLDHHGSFRSRRDHQMQYPKSTFTNMRTTVQTEKAKRV